MRRPIMTKAVAKKRKSAVLRSSPKRASLKRRNPIRMSKNVISSKSLAYESPLDHLRLNGMKKTESKVNTTDDSESLSDFILDVATMQEHKKEVYNDSIIVIDDMDGADNKNNIDTSILNKDSKYFANSKRTNVIRMPFFDWNYCRSPSRKERKRSTEITLPSLSGASSSSHSRSIIELNDTEIDIDDNVETGLLHESDHLINFQDNSETGLVNKSVLDNLKESFNKTISNEVIDLDCTIVPSTSLPQTSKCNENIESNIAHQNNDTIIILDENSEEPEWNKVSPKPIDDCCVVWSSLPEKSRKDTENFSDTDDFLDKISFIDKGDYIPLDSKKCQSKPLYRVLKTSLTPKTLRSTKSKIKKSKVTRRLSKEELNNKSRRSSDKDETLKKSRKKDVDSMLIHRERLNNNSPQPSAPLPKKSNLREIVIDGMNVAMACTHSKSFSEKGIKLLIDYFTKLGHEVKVFIPQHRRSIRYPLLEKWYTEDIVIFTPSRKVGTKRYTSYDDRFILEYATACDGIVVSQDQYRDLYQEQDRWKKTIEERLLVPTFVGDYVMFPKDPLGRFGPSLEEFLKR